MLPEFDAHESQRLSTKIWLGVKEGEWPIRVFAAEIDAQRWQAEHDPVRVRRVWELRTETAVERRVEVVPEQIGWRS